MAELYPDIKELHAYRYMPHKGNRERVIEFICIKWINETEYTMMILKDSVSDEGDGKWVYGDVEVGDWRVDIEEIEAIDFEIECAIMCR